jgi:hypothetical protein
MSARRRYVELQNPSHWASAEASMTKGYNQEDLLCIAILKVFDEVSECPRTPFESFPRSGDVAGSNSNCYQDVYVSMIQRVNEHTEDTWLWTVVYGHLRVLNIVGVLHNGS